MNKYEKKVEKMMIHLENHPNDYQTLISALKSRSHGIIYNKKKSHDLKRKEIAEYRKEYK